MTILWSNNASTTVAGSITATDTTVALAAGTGVKFPNPTAPDYFICTFYDNATKTQNEIVHVTARVGDTCTIVRAQEGTVAQAWNAADIFANLVTAGTLRAFVQAGPPAANTSVVYVGLDTSTNPNQIIANTTPVPSAYGIGMLFNIRKNNIAGYNGNTAATTMQLNGQPALPVTRTDGGATAGGDLINGEEMVYIYNEGDPVAHTNPHFTSLVPPIKKSPPSNIFYVDPVNGNDSNDGLAPGAGHAFKTLRGAVTNIQGAYISTELITVRCAAGSYTNDFINIQGTYIAQWEFDGDTSGGGANSAYVIDCRATGTGNAAVGGELGAAVTVKGFTLRSFAENVGCIESCIFTFWDCAFTCPVGGAGFDVIISSGGAVINIYGNCSYDGSVGTQNALFAPGLSSVIALGYHDQFNNYPFHMNFINPQLTGAVAGVNSGGQLVCYDAAMSFSGTMPTCPQYIVSAGGGIVFVQGNVNILPGSPGIVQPPGWIY